MADDFDPKKGVNLAQFYNWAVKKLATLLPKFTFSGYVLGNNVFRIPVPTSVQEAIDGKAELFRPVVYINGLQLDPRLTSFPPGCPIYINIDQSIKLYNNDRFTVIIEHFDLFIEEQIVAS
jgi:hypothetical protein